MGVGAVIDPAVPAEVALSAEGFHIHCHAIAGAHGFHLCSDGFHDADHLMTDRDAGYGARYRAVLDMQIAGADRPQRYPHDGVTGALQYRLRLFQKGKVVVL